MASLIKYHNIKLCVDEDKILVENKASSTYDNDVFSKDIIEEHSSDFIILRVFEYHAKRSKLTIEKVIEDLDVKIMMAH